MAQSGRLIEGDRTMARGLDEYQRSESLMSKPWYLMLFADVDRQANRLDQAMSRIDEALGLCAQTAEELVLPECERVLGTILEANGDPVRATRHYLKAHEIAVSQKSRSCELRAAMDLARVDPDAAPMVSEAYEWFIEGFGTSDLRNARRLIAELA